jgi:hypothetical protein
MRERAVRSVQNGENPEVVARVIGVNVRRCTGGWRSIGVAAGERSKPSRCLGVPPKLDGKKLKWIYDTVT